MNTPLLVPIAHYLADKLILSHSSRALAQSCMRKFEFRKLFGAMVEREDNFAGAVGTSLHNGFQKWLMSQDENASIMAMMLSYPYEQEFEESRNSSRSLEACYATLMAMINSHLIANYEIVQVKDMEGKLRFAVEVPFAIQIINSPCSLPVWYVGFIDCILFDRTTGEYIVVDIKTTRQAMNDYTPKYQYDEQTVPYGIILEHALGRSIGDFNTKYLSVWVDLLEPKVSLYPFKKTQDHVRDWHLGLCEDVQRISRFIDKKWFPRATSGDACVSWNRPCEFSDICYERDISRLNRLTKFEMRKGLFHDDIQPWIVAELEYLAI